MIVSSIFHTGTRRKALRAARAALTTRVSQSLFMDTVAETLSVEVTNSRLPSTHMASHGVSEVAPDVCVSTD
jgi:hypothetical protein